MLLDGHSLAYRAFFALPVENFKTAGGQTTNAVFGFTSMLINLLRDEQPTHIAAAFDVSRQTFRSERYPEYKAQRDKSPDEFRGQVDLTKEVLGALRIPRQQFCAEPSPLVARRILTGQTTQRPQQAHQVKAVLGILRVGCVKRSLALDASSQHHARRPDLAVLRERFAEAQVSDCQELRPLRITPRRLFQEPPCRSHRHHGALVLRLQREAPCPPQDRSAEWVCGELQGVGDSLRLGTLPDRKSVV